MKLLFITNHDPLSVGYGAGQRTHLILKALCSIGETTTIWLTESRKEIIELTDVEGNKIYRIANSPTSISEQWWNALESRKLSQLVMKAVNLRDYDIIICRYVTPATKLKLPQDVPLLIDFDDSSYTVPWSSIRSPMELAKELIKLANYLLVGLKIKHTMLKQCSYAFISSRERKQWPSLCGDILPNIPHIPKSIQRPDLVDRNVILFVGLMTYRQNIEAVDFFLQHVWPGVLEKCPDAVFQVVGKIGANQKTKWLKHPSCLIEGYVDDLSTYYSGAALSVSPILSGGGSNIKVAETCAYACPVVVSEFSYAGLSDYLRRDLDVLVAGSALEFCKHCVFILKNPHTATSMAKNAQLQVQQRLSFSTFRKQLQQMIHSTIQEKQRVSIK